MYLSDSDYFTQPATLEQTQVYTYIRDLSLLPYTEAIAQFYHLLWEGMACSSESVQKALKQVVSAPNFDQHKLNLVNRCYYTLANPWHLDGGKDFAVEKLILQLEDLPSTRGHNPVIRKLRDTLHEYRQDERYDVLKKHLRLLNTDKDGVAAVRRDQYFGDRFPDYFFIYEAGTQTPDIESSGANLNEGIRQKRDRRLQQLRQTLNQFYVRSHRSESAIPMRNPTHLPEAELIKAMNIYQPRRQNSFKQQADQFKAQSQSLRSTAEFKQVIHDHTMGPIRQLGPKYVKSFNRLFQTALDGFQRDVPLTPIVKIQLFRRLLVAIFQGHSSQANGDQFCYLVNGVGANIVTSILLNLVLSCEMIRFDLEKRLAQLHHRFSSSENSSMEWLAHAFDHMNVALALNARYLGYFSLGASHNGSIPDSI
ncbi:MAG: hypothetical protein VKJ64_17300 [Leptolyngbyaceae bacterium]|nr:hypothetical protein [Leptolyngbyaceae bacterium]